MKRKNWLILSHAFNMDGRAASQTITDKIPFLIKRNISIQVLSAISGEKDSEIQHRQLLPWSASGLIFDFRFWLRKKIGKGVFYNACIFSITVLLLPFLLIEKLIIKLPSNTSWAIPASLIGIYRVKKHRANLVYSTGGAWSAHLAGYWIWKITKVPWIVELHDPLFSVYDENIKDRKIRTLIWLEKKIADHASLIWWFTEGAEKRGKTRNNQIKNRGFSELAGANPPVPLQPYEKKSKLSFSHFGSLVEGRDLVPFIEGLNSLIRSNRIDMNSIEINIYGGRIDSASENIIRKYNLDSVVIDHGRVEASGLESGRQRIMREMMKSDVLLLIHGNDKNCEEYIPSKFYEYLYAKRPILAFTSENSQFRRLLERTNCYQVNDNNRSAEAIEIVINDWETDNLKITTEIISTEKLVSKIIQRVNYLS